MVFAGDGAMQMNGLARAAMRIGSVQLEATIAFEIRVEPRV